MGVGGLPSPEQSEAMDLIHDAESLLGLSRHLSAYVISPAHAALESLQFAGQVYELAWRLRESQLSSAERVRAIAQEAKIGPRHLDREVLPALESLGWVRCDRGEGGQLLSVAALIPPAEQLLAAATDLLNLVLATPVQRSALLLLRATSRQPLEREAALNEAAEFGEEAAEEAMRHLTSIHLLRQVRGEDGRIAAFNPNVWVGDDEITRAALRTEDARVRREVGALLEEVAAAPGIPEAHVTATEQRWIDFAVAQGLVQRSVVQTSDGAEQRFLFSPHLGRDPFGLSPGDASGHVRQLVGSMIYAATFASWKLQSPGAFLYSLIRDGVAGNVPQIGTDYPMLETAGIIQVVPGRGPSNYQMRLLQGDVAEAALTILDSRGRTSATGVESAAALGYQRAYTHIERERARLASEITLDDADARRLIDGLRDASARRSFGAR